MLSDALPAQVTTATPTPAPPVLPKVLGEKAIGPYIALDKDEEEQNKDVENDD